MLRTVAIKDVEVEDESELNRVVRELLHWYPGASAQLQPDLFNKHKFRIVIAVETRRGKTNRGV